MLRNYRRRGRLQGHLGAIYSLVATDDGKLLASGGNDGTRIWNLPRMAEVPDRPANGGLRGATTAITWTNRDDEPGDILFYGTINGYLVSWRQSAGREGFHEVFCRRLSQPSEVTALAFDAPSNRLAVCNYNSIVQVYAMSSPSKPQKLFAVNIENFVPKSIHFGAMRGNDREILVFGGRDGKIRTLTGSLEIDNYSEPWEIGVCIGDAAVDTRIGMVCIDDPQFGAILYRLHDHQQLKKFPVPVTKQNRPRQVRYGDDSKVIVIGSDHGTVYVYDRRSGELVGKLLSKSQDWVQTIATADCNGVPTIFVAKSEEDGGRNNIVLWRKAIGTRRVCASVSDSIILILQASMLLASLGLVYQNRELLEEIIREKLANFNLKN
ncbi:WD40-repeat-containing domain protein [Mycena capillaripes]|nr:WD40-repeat-containing domain protein [Mycena capillaripes]